MFDGTPPPTLLDDSKQQASLEKSNILWGFKMVQIMAKRLTITRRTFNILIRGRRNRNHRNRQVTSMESTIEITETEIDSPWA